ncbi:MAG: thiosulfate dehydrogenase (quinone) large subunit [Thermoplasmata archaeon]|jgi:thiosulfate dehydrogenase [quinone] large subunit|nr:thiosulfate dehydrogenase (quinone) large subunit [Thermoplasmata archaeon]
MADKAATAWALLRIALGWIFFWPFLDKTFGLGFRTPHDGAWIRGGHPTRGFLNGADGWFKDVYHAMADVALVEWLFMLGLLLIGLSLIFGIGVRIACYSGIAMMTLMYLAEVGFRKGVATNPFMDEHVVYALALLGLSFVHAGRRLGLGSWWARQPVVQKHPMLE